MSSHLKRRSKKQRKKNCLKIMIQKPFTERGKFFGRQFKRFEAFPKKWLQLIQTKIALRQTKRLSLSHGKNPACTKCKTTDTKINRTRSNKENSSMFRKMSHNNICTNTDIVKTNCDCENKGSEQTPWCKENNVKGPTKVGAIKEDKNYVYFWRKDDVFSQWYPCAFTIGKHSYSCAEQYMMHRKAELFGDHYAAREILLTDNPEKHKKLGRSVQNFNEEIWQLECEQYVTEGNKEKFSQNVHLKCLLYSTYPKTLVEASPYDRVWGIGLHAEDELAWNERNWWGNNKLGFILTNLRNSMMQEDGLFPPDHIIKVKCKSDTDKNEQGFFPLGSGSYNSFTEKKTKDKINICSAVTTGSLKCNTSVEMGEDAFNLDRICNVDTGTTNKDSINVGMRKMAENKWKW